MPGSTKPTNVNTPRYPNLNANINLYGDEADALAARIDGSMYVSATSDTSSSTPPPNIPSFSLLRPAHLQLSNSRAPRGSAPRLNTPRREQPNDFERLSNDSRPLTLRPENSEAARLSFATDRSSSPYSSSPSSSSLMAPPPSLASRTSDDSDRTDWSELLNSPSMNNFPLPLSQLPPAPLPPAPRAPDPLYRRPPTAPPALDAPNRYSRADIYGQQQNSPYSLAPPPPPSQLSLYERTGDDAALSPAARDILRSMPPSRPPLPRRKNTNPPY